MVSDDLQFGFKSHLGCSNAIFLLRRVISHFTDRQSNVYIASLDASKAFDRVNHYKLFSTLIKLNLPEFFIDTIINWYSRLSVNIRWCDSYSTSLRILSGVRQGGVLSPTLFNIYIDPMIKTLRKSDIGCHMYNMFAGCIMYADDLVLLSASVFDLQNMIDICNSVANDLSIVFNIKKSKCISIGPISNLLPAPILIDATPLEWSQNITYLGINILSDKVFKINLEDIRRKFFVSVNSILSKCNYTSDTVKLSLMESHCLPILLYATESLNLPSSQVKEINSWWNSVYRKIFGYNKWESVKYLILMLGRLDIYHIINQRSIIFMVRMLHNDSNSLFIETLMKSYSQIGEYNSLFDLSDCKDYWSVGKLKAAQRSAFKTLVMAKLRA